MTARTPFAWEARYPSGLAWDASIATTSLGEHLAGSVARHGDRVALVYRDARIGYAALGEMVRCAAAGFLGMAEARSGVGLLLPNSPWHSVAFFGAASAGVRLMQVSPMDAERELAHKLANSGARVLVTLAEDGLLRRARAMVARGLVDRLVVADDAHWGGPAGVGVPALTEPVLSATGGLTARLGDDQVEKRPQSDRTLDAASRSAACATRFPSQPCATGRLALYAERHGTMVEIVLDAAPAEPESVFVQMGKDRREVVATAELKLWGFCRPRQQPIGPSIEPM